jgi:hypothetical protein
MSEEKPLRLEISGLLQRAEHIEKVIKEKLVTHKGLEKVSVEVTAAAKTADHVSRKMKRPFSAHHIPAAFLAIALLSLLGWAYWKFMYVSTLRIALPDRDATVLREKVRQDTKVKLEPVLVPGSRESVSLLVSEQADIAFVQGGIPIPKTLPRLETQSPELILFLTRGQIPFASVTKVLTSTENEGSHSVAQDFFPLWGKQKIQYQFLWKDLTSNDAFVVPGDINAVFVVKDPAEEKTLTAMAHLYEAGFVLRSPEIGARAARFDYLSQIQIEAGFLDENPNIPQEALTTYAVKTYLVARQDLTPRLLAAAALLLEDKATTITQNGYALTAGEIGNVFGAIGDVLEVILDIGLAFLGLLGIEMATYRKRFHELNSLVSLLGMLQSNKDVIGLDDDHLKQENLLYLRLCSDLLSLISAISGYYTQENASLSFNSLPEIIHQRCDGLKINIQLKILHVGL